MNQAQWLARAGRAFGDCPATAVGARVVRDYRQTASRAARLAEGFRQAGLEDGARIAILAKNGPGYVELLYAAWWAGMAAVPINAKLHRDEVAYILGDSGAALVFASDDLLETASAAVDMAGTSARVIAVGGTDHDRLMPEKEAMLATVDPDSLAWLFYTSGTTGRPKGAVISHRNIAHMTYGYFSCVANAVPGEAVLHAAPMSHGSGLYIMPHVYKGCCQVVPESGGFDPAEIFETIGHWPGTAMFGAPTMVNRMTRWPGEITDAQLQNLKVVIYGGAPMYVEDCEAALNRLGPRLAQIYGQGESPMNITCLETAQIANRDHPRWREILGSAGLPYPNVEVRVVDADDNPVPVGESGEIICRGDSVMPGYWNRPEANAETLRGGWLHTGDVGRFDEEGYLTLMDRSKDLIISGGSNIYPREVEEVLLTHPGVKEVSVIGRRDPEWGEVVVAYVVGEAKEVELDALCLDRIARFKRPKSYMFTDALPKNNYGKILKTELRVQDAKGLEE